MALTDRLCPFCSAWPVSANDAYCGHCQKPIGKLRIILEYDCLDWETEYCEVKAILQNPTCKTVFVDSIDISAYPGGGICSWATVEGLQAGALAPGDQRRFKIYCDISGIANIASQVHARGELESDDGDGILVVCPQKPPRMVIEPPFVETWLGGPTDFKARLYPETGIVRARNLTNGSGAWLKLSPGSNGLSGGRLVSRERPLEVPLSLNSELFQRTPAGSVLREQVEIQITYAAGPAEDITVPATINLQSLKRPDFRCLDEGGIRRTLAKTDQRQITLKFQNGDLGSHSANLGPLRILGIRPSEGAEWTMDFRDEQKPTFPLDILGGQRKEISALLDLRNLERGERDLTFQVDTGQPATVRFVTVPVKIEPLVRYKGKLVIDFGTTNTCAALVRGGTFQPDLQKIDSSEPHTTSATALLYLSLKQEPPKLKTGNEPRSLASGRVVRRLKQRLGGSQEEEQRAEQVQSESSPQFVYRKVWMQAADYLREVRRTLERTEFFSDIVLTHPAICSLTHFRNMKKALSVAFPDKQAIYFLQEPIAALTPFMYEKGLEFQADPTKGLSEYRVAAFDMGGGTTDVTVVAVKNQRIGQVTEIEPMIQKSWGVRFGGENLTDFLIEQIRARFESLMHDRQCTLVYGTEHDNQEAAAANKSIIERWAEPWKLAFTAGNYSKVPNLSLTVVRDRQEMPQSVSREELESCLLDGKTLPDAYKHHLTSVVNELVDRLLGSSQDGTLDFIQLSGKSSQIPAVQEAVEARLRNSGSQAQVVRADQLTRVGRADLKECVVYGAALWYGSYAAGTLVFNKQGSDQRTTSRVGLNSPDKGFDAMIELDQVIDPKQGLLSNIRSISWRYADQVLAIHENLAERNEAVIDGVANDDITLSAQFEALPADGEEIADWSRKHPGALVDVQLHLTPDLDLEAFIQIPDGSRFQLRQIQ